MGRAVLIGIIQDIDSGECDTTGTGGYISGYIDWIGDNMKIYANDSHLNSIVLNSFSNCLSIL